MVIQAGLDVVINGSKSVITYATAKHSPKTVP